MEFALDAGEGLRRVVREVEKQFRVSATFF